MNWITSKIPHLQMGGKLSEIPTEKKQQLLPFFVYLKMLAGSPETAELPITEVASMFAKNGEEVLSAISQDEEQAKQVAKLASQATPEDWSKAEELATEYQNLQSQQEVEYAAKGAKLKQLKKRKCACGCDMIVKKSEGGKLMEECACHCKGGKMKPKKK